MELIILVLTFLGTVAGMLQAINSSTDRLTEIRDLLIQIRDRL